MENDGGEGVGGGGGRQSRKGGLREGGRGNSAATCLHDGNRLVGGVRGAGAAWVEMWRCKACETKSFASRAKCFKCGRARPGAPVLVLEKWSTSALAGSGGGWGLGAERRFLEGSQDRRTLQKDGGEARPRAARTQSERQASDKPGGRGVVQAANGAGPNKAKQESPGDVHREAGKDKTWAQVAATKQNEMGTRPNAVAAPRAASKGVKGSAAPAEERREEDESEEQVAVPPRGL